VKEKLCKKAEENNGKINIFVRYIATIAEKNNVTNRGLENEEISLCSKNHFRKSYYIHFQF